MGSFLEETNRLHSAYSNAVIFLDSFLETEEAEAVMEFLADRLVESINQMEVSDDEDEAENQLRRIVLDLQVKAFLTGAFWSDNEPVLNTGSEKNREELLIELDSDAKLELTRSLLNGDGISLKIL